MYRHGQAYLFTGENVSGQFDHSKVSTPQRLVQIIEPSDLPIMMTFEPRHGCGLGRRGCLLLLAGVCSVLHLLLSRFKLGEACGSGSVDSRSTVDLSR